MQLRAVKMLDAFGRIFAGAHGHVTIATSAGRARVRHYFGANNLEHTTNLAGRQKTKQALSLVPDFTFPYLEKTCFKSVARVEDDRPLTHKFRLLLPLPVLTFLSENNDTRFQTRSVSFRLKITLIAHLCRLWEISDLQKRWNCGNNASVSQFLVKDR